MIVGCTSSPAFIKNCFKGHLLLNYWLDLDQTWQAWLLCWLLISWGLDLFGLAAFFAAGFLAAFFAFFQDLGLATLGLTAFFTGLAFLTSPRRKDPEAPVPFDCFKGALLTPYLSLPRKKLEIGNHFLKVSS